MKTFDKLTSEEQARAVDKAANRLLQSICEGAMRFNDKLNGDDMQARIDRAGAEAERLQTPWFLGEIIMEDKVLAGNIRGMAQCDAEDSLYSAPDEWVVAGVVAA